MLLLAAVVSCGPAEHESVPARVAEPFYRFVEDAVFADAWHETKVSLDAESRNVLHAPRVTPARLVVLPESGVAPLGDLVDCARISDSAGQMRIFAKVAPGTMDWQDGNEPGMVVVDLPQRRTPEKLAAIEVAVPLSKGPRRDYLIRAEELVPVTREYVSGPVHIPPAARLDFAIGMKEYEGNPSRITVRFTVKLDTGRWRPTTVFDEVCMRYPDDLLRKWLDRSVDLSAFDGATARFIFKTELVSDPEVEEPPIFAALWGSPILLAQGAARPAASPPNLILISLDTLRADRLGCHGYPKDTSPFLDRLVEETLFFETAVAPSTWTTPSHASLFTGLHPSVHEAGMWSTRDPSRPRLHLRPEWVSLAELAREAGYLTAAYTEGGAVSSWLGFGQGFEQYWDGHRTQNDSTGYILQTFNRARQWIDLHRQFPFFLFIHTYECHEPYWPPPEFVERLAPDVKDTGVLWPRFAETDDDKQWIAANYDGEVAFTDETLGNFIAWLREEGILDNTALVIFSDHGEELWDHGCYGHTTQIYDEVLRVPLIIRLPGAQPAARRIPELVSLTDVFATALELMEIEHEPPPDCISLLNLIKGRPYARRSVTSDLCQPAWFEDTHTVSEWLMRAHRVEGEKYIVSNKDWVLATSRDGSEAPPSAYTEELYDLRADPGERHDIAADSAPGLEFHRSDLDAYLKAVVVERPATALEDDAPEPLNEEQMDQLRNMGYFH
ncbi:MAG: sulfatase [Candidatus Hydrogenedentes bacterium]|nr:sulfatase [Candidatus Hydrogenedentota bacterium]